MTCKFKRTPVNNIFGNELSKFLEDRYSTFFESQLKVVSNDLVTWRQANLSSNQSASGSLKFAHIKSTSFSAPRNSFPEIVWFTLYGKILKCS